MFVDESQQAGQAAYVAVHGDDRQTRGALGNDPIREEVLRRLGQKKVALHGLSTGASHKTFSCWRRNKSLASVLRKRSLPS